MMLFAALCTPDVLTRKQHFNVAAGEGETIELHSMLVV